MEIINSDLLKYNLGLDAGDNLTNILFEKKKKNLNKLKINYVMISIQL